MPPNNLPTGDTGSETSSAPAPTIETKKEPVVTPAHVGMSKKEEIILAFLITAGIVIAIWGIIWATHQTSNSAKNSTEQTQQQTNSNNGGGVTPYVENGWRTFTDSAKRFSVDSPDIATIVTDKTNMEAVGYIPTCNPDNGIVCVYLPTHTFPKSNFDGAGVSINITGDKNASSCTAIKNGETLNTTERIISGISFASFSTSDAAMSHQSAGSDYRVFYNNTCYEITTRINSTSFDVYEAGTINRFTDEERVTTGRILERVVSNFKFLK